MEFCMELSHSKIEVSKKLNTRVELKVRKVKVSMTNIG